MRLESRGEDCTNSRAYHYYLPNEQSHCVFSASLGCVTLDQSFGPAATPYPNTTKTDEAQWFTRQLPQHWPKGARCRPIPSSTARRAGHPRPQDCETGPRSACRDPQSTGYSLGNHRSTISRGNPRRTGALWLSEISRRRPSSFERTVRAMRSW